LCFVWLCCGVHANTMLQFTLKDVIATGGKITQVISVPNKPETPAVIKKRGREVPQGGHMTLHEIDFEHRVVRIYDPHEDRKLKLRRTTT